MNFLSRKLKGWGALHTAVDSGDLRKVQVAVQGGASIDEKDKEGWAPIHIAAARGFEFIVAELLDRQATATVPNKEGMTPVHLAAQNGHAAVLQLLLGPRNRRDVALVKAQLVNGRDQAGRTPLILATQSGHLQLAMDLVRANSADPNMADASGCTPFMAAAQKGEIHTLSSLLSVGATLEGPRLPQQGWSPLHAAAAAGQEAAAMWLVKAGANLATKDNQARTPADVALESGHNTLCRQLKDAAGQRASGGGASGGGAALVAATAPPAADASSTWQAGQTDKPPAKSAQSLSELLAQRAAQPPATSSAYPELPPGAVQYY